MIYPHPIMPRFPPKEKRFSIDARVRSLSKAFKKRKIGTVRSISHVGEGPRRRRRIEVEWDDLSREIVLSNAIELLDEDHDFKDNEMLDSPQQLLSPQQQLRQDPAMIQLRLANDSDSENEDDDINMPSMIDPSMVTADGQYHVFTMEGTGQSTITAISSQGNLANHPILATQHLHMKVCL